MKYIRPIPSTHYELEEPKEPSKYELKEAIRQASERADNERALELEEQLYYEEHESR